MINSFKKSLIFLFTFLLLLFLNYKNLYAENDSHTLSFAAAGEIWKNNDISGHGIFLVHYQYKPNPEKQLTFYYNTETLFLGYDYRIDKNLTWGVSVKGELNFAGLLPDFYKRGEILKTGGFNASYLEGETYLAIYFSNYHTIRFYLLGKQWFFKNNSDTGINFVLPKDFLQIEPKLSYTFWNLESDKSLYEVHRFFPRVKGLAFGVTMGLIARNTINTWGFLNSPDIRINNPHKLTLYLDEWLTFGIPVSRIFRINIKQTAFYAPNMDDINRKRIGGINPYVVQVAGLPWAALLSDKHLSLHLGLIFGIFGESELGIGFDFVYLEDVERTGIRDWNKAMGFSLHVDIRFGNWQLDIKGGISLPANWMENKLHYSFFVSFGRKFSF